MALNLPIQLYRGTLADLSTLASTGKIGVLAWTTDSMEMYVDQGSGTAGYGNPGSGAAWIRAAGGNQAFSAASQSAMLALAGALVGDICVRSDNGNTYMLTAYPSSTLGNWTLIGVSSLSIPGGGPVTNEFVTAISSNGTATLAQPSFSNLSGQATQGQLPSSIDCGSF